jgi:hypothetical protein
MSDITEELGISEEDQLRGPGNWRRYRRDRRATSNAHREEFSTEVARARSLGAGGQLGGILA